MNTNKRESEEIARIHGRPGQVARITGIEKQKQSQKQTLNTLAADFREMSADENH